MENQTSAGIKSSDEDLTRSMLVGRYECANKKFYLIWRERGGPGNGARPVSSRRTPVHWRRGALRGLVKPASRMG